MWVLVRESIYFFRYDPLLYSALGSVAKGRVCSVCSLHTVLQAASYRVKSIFSFTPLSETSHISGLIKRKKSPRLCSCVDRSSLSTIQSFNIHKSFSPCGANNLEMVPWRIWWNKTRKKALSTSRNSHANTCIRYLYGLFSSEWIKKRKSKTLYKYLVLIIAMHT